MHCLTVLGSEEEWRLKGLVFCGAIEPSLFLAPTSSSRFSLPTYVPNHSQPHSQVLSAQGKFLIASA